VTAAKKNSEKADRMLFDSKRFQGCHTCYTNDLKCSMGKINAGCFDLQAMVGFIRCRAALMSSEKHISRPYTSWDIMSEMRKPSRFFVGLSTSRTTADQAWI
jgi:hypothetical protein